MCYSALRLNQCLLSEGSHIRSLLLRLLRLFGTAMEKRGAARGSEARQQRAAAPRVCMCIGWLLMSDLSLPGAESWFPEVGAQKRAGCDRPGLVMQDIDPAEGRWSTFCLPTHRVVIGSGHNCDEAEAAESACGTWTPAA
jgi:hypothetical protein